MQWPGGEGGGGGGGAAANANAGGNAPAPPAPHGAKIRVRGLNGMDETIEQEGEWGLFRLLEAGIARGRTEGRVFSVVWRLRDQRGIEGNRFVEIGVDIRPARSENPFVGVPRADNQTVQLLRPFRGGDIAAPHPIARTGRTCDLSGVPGAPPRAERFRDEGGRRHRRSRRSSQQ